MLKFNSTLKTTSLFNFHKISITQSCLDTWPHVYVHELEYCLLPCTVQIMYSQRWFLYFLFFSRWKVGIWRKVGHRWLCTTVPLCSTHSQRPCEKPDSGGTSGSRGSCRLKPLFVGPFFVSFPWASNPDPLAQPSLWGLLNPLKIQPTLIFSRTIKWI